MIKRNIFFPKSIYFIFLLISFHTVNAQLYINEGSNKNYTTLPDEDGEYPDWIELYNSSGADIDLYNYSLTDDSTITNKWTFPHVHIAAGEYKPVFCSAKDRKPITGFVNVINTGVFTPTTGWNTHTFTTPFLWDGISNILINTCSYSSAGYVTNSVFNQSATPFASTVYAFQDGSPASCGFAYGTPVNQRPNMQINGYTIGTGTINNSPYDYPAPYGNWYWGARNQMLILASELTAAGVTAGYINSLAFDIASTDPVIYDYIDINMKLVSYSFLSATFEQINPYNYQHTNFKVSGTGEKVFLYSPSQNLLSSLVVNCPSLDVSIGSSPDASGNIVFFSVPTPGGSNNASATFTSQALAPTFSLPSGFYSGAQSISITNTNSGNSQVRITLDGSDPTDTSILYNGTPLNIAFTCVLKARVFKNGVLPSQISAASYFFGINHSTPVLSVITNDANLHGATGIFDNWWTDWQKAAYAEYFDTLHNLIFGEPVGLQMDGGAGGSRSQPQHSFRLEMGNDVLGGGAVNYLLIPDRTDRTKYSSIYLRNGSNQYLVLPHKDAAQVKMMCEETNNYYSAWRPVSVYINGSYFGLYELREKFDAEYFKTHDGANSDSVSLLSLSYWYGSVLRSVKGSVDSFWNASASFNALNTADTAFWTNADHYFDMKYYEDYIIGQSWMGNVDWPGNNIKLYRSDKTNYRWRFCLIDQELAMAPNSWTDCYFDHINYMLGQNPSNPYIGIWLKGIQNNRFRDYFINRFADLMNTTYKYARLSSIEDDMYSQTVLEMQNEYQRWGDPANIPAQMINYYNNHLTFLDQLLNRTQTVRNNIKNDFNLPKQVTVSLDVVPAGAGRIIISTISPEDYPWTGIYFDGLPVTVEAVANPGYHFVHWGNYIPITDTLNIVWLDTLKNVFNNFTAYFEVTGVGIPEATFSSNDFSIFPSPASSIIYCANSNKNTDNEFEISDMNGRIILTGKLNNSDDITAIDIQALAPSLYIFRVKKSGANLKQFRFVKIAE